MTAIFALLVKFGPWALAGIAGLFAAFTRLNSKAKVADAQQKAQIDVATAQAAQQVAVDNLNARKTADVQADADAAKSAASAAQERTNAENAQAVLNDDAARAQLIGLPPVSEADPHSRPNSTRTITTTSTTPSTPDGQ